MWMHIMRNDNPSCERVGSRMPLGSPSRPTASSCKNIALEESHNGDNMTAPSRDSPSAEQVLYLYFIFSQKEKHLYILIYVLTILHVIK